MYDGLARAVATVLDDVRSQGAILPEVVDEPWASVEGQESARLTWPNGAGVGIWVMRDAAPCEQVAAVGDQVQDFEVEVLAAASLSAVWPECPRHPSSHPLAAVVRDGVAVWTCRVIDEVIAPIGAIGELRRRSRV